MYLREIDCIMFILLISRGTPSKYDPQWGCFEKDQAEALTALGYKVIVVSVDSRFRLIPRKYGLAHTVINGINYYSSFYLPGALSRKLGGFKFNLFLKQLQLDRIYKYIFKMYGKPDIIYSHYLSNTYLATRLKDKYDIPIVAIEHWSKVNLDQLSLSVKFMGEYAYRKVDKLIAVSDSLRKRLLQHFNIDSLVIHNMVGREFCNEVPLREKGNEIVFISTGRLVYLKGYDLLISAFAKCEFPRNEWKLYIVGDGGEKNKLSSLINNSGLQNNIILLGVKNKCEISNLLSESDVFILPSRTENFSVAVLEALCMGLPVIASICGGIRECIDESNGILFPVDDELTLVDCLEQMYCKCKLYNRERIALNARNKFSPNSIANQLNAVFENCAKYK